MNIDNKPTHSPVGKVFPAIPICMVITGFVLIFVAPRDEFIRGEQVGVYWLYFNAFDIWYFLTLMAGPVALSGILFVIFNALYQRYVGAVSILLTIVNVGVLAWAVVSFAGTYDFPPAIFEADRVQTSWHVYYMAESWETDSINRAACKDWCSEYLIFECDFAGVFCKRVFKSQPLPSLRRGATSVVLTADDQSEQIRLMNDLDVVWTSSSP